MKHFFRTLLILFVSFLLLSSSALACDKCSEETSTSHPYETHSWEETLVVPDEVLLLPTEELLDYFLNSQFLFNDVCLRSVPLTEDNAIDYSIHPAYAELITRSDILLAIEKKANISTKADAPAFIRTKLQSIVSQKSIQKLLSSSPLTKESLHNTLFIDSDPIEKSSARSYAFFINNIGYYNAGTISSVHGNTATVYAPARELNSREISALNSGAAQYGNRVHEPTSRYNCHSYAWYKAQTWNPYWLSNIVPFTSDNACTQVTTPIQDKDIIAYYYNGQLQHSGIVYSKSGGQTIIKSKFGQGGVYLHTPESVPYTHNSIIYYRYHDYAQQYTGNHYHNGSFHYYEKAYVCRVCGKSFGAYYVQMACSGPPCMIPFKIDDLVDR